MSICRSLTLKNVVQCLIATSLLYSGVVRADAAPTQVRVTGGAIQGEVTDRVLSYKGIPFAAPPVGFLRWRPPQPVHPWNGVLQARSFGPDCMQKVDKTNANIGIPLQRTDPSEDCLYLNVYRPSERSDRPLPVMVWFFGGGFSTGGTSPILFQGTELAKQGVIFVGFNYRLGRFGFFGHPALSAEHPDEPKANYGLMDQIAALQWIQRNIGSFGGDPSNVTIFGESAGGVSVNAMIVSPLARGLFQKAIVQSGPNMNLFTRGLKVDQPGRVSLEKLGLAFAASKGIDGSNDRSLTRLRNLPALELIDLASGLPATTDESRTPWGGTSMDGKVLPIVDGDYFKLGRFTPVPLLIGANGDDITASTRALENRSLDYTLSRFGSLQAQALRAYDAEGSGDARLVRRRVAADDHMIEPTRYIANQVSLRGVPVYRYFFNYVPEALRSRWLYGPPHGSDIAFVFNILRFNYGPAFSEQDLAMARTMSGYWVNFAKSGNPNGDSLPEWPRYDPNKDEIMHFRPNGIAAAGPDPLKQRLDLTAVVAERLRDPTRRVIDRNLPQWPRFEPPTGK